MRSWVVALWLFRTVFVILVCIPGITWTTWSLSIAPQQQQQLQQRRQNEQQILLLTRRLQSNRANSKNSIHSSYYYETPEHAYRELLLFKHQQDNSSSDCWESPTLALLKMGSRHVCSPSSLSLLLNNTNNYGTNITIDADWAHSVWQTMCPDSLAARQAVIQIYSQQLHQCLTTSSSQRRKDRQQQEDVVINRTWNQIRQLVYLSHSPTPTTTVALLNSALAAAPTGTDALLLYHETHATTLQWSTLSHNLVLTKLALGDDDNSTAALAFFESIMIPALCYNRQSFQILLSRKEKNPLLIQRLQLLCMASSIAPKCRDLFPSTLFEPHASKRQRPKWPEHIVQRWNDTSSRKDITTAATTTTKHFVVATMGSFTVTAQPNRQSNTDLRLILWNTDGPPQRVGYMLLTTAETCDALHHSLSTSSSLMGVYLDPCHRQKGLSKQFMTCWIQLCERAQLIPQTEIIRKPLLCLVLQHSLGFVPVDMREGVDIEVYPSSKDGNKIRVYSSMRCLEGIFSPWDVQREQLDLCVQRPSGLEMGRSIRIHGRFIRSVPNAGNNSIPEDADGEKWNCLLTCAELRTIIIGEGTTG